jgi:hypothetical protein
LEIDDAAEGAGVVSEREEHEVEAEGLDSKGPRAM